MTVEERDLIDQRNHALHDLNTRTRLDLERAAAFRNALTLNRVEAGESWKGNISEYRSDGWTSMQQSTLLQKYFDVLLKL